MKLVIPQIETILDLVRTRLAQDLCNQSGEELREIKTVQVLKRPYSSVTILKVATDSGTRRVVLKQITEHPLNASVVDDPDQAAVEFGILTKMYPKFAEIDRCSVPRPILVLPEINAYLMEFVEGHILVDHLNFVHYLASRANFRQLRNHFYDCGKWLRHFQEFNGRRPATTSAIDNVILRCHDRLRIIEKADDRRVPKDCLKKAADFIGIQVERLANTEILVTGRHGDFGPWNTLAGDDGVTVFDFYGFREDPLPVDIFSMLVYLESIEHGIANSSYRMRMLREKFLAGYGPIPQLPESLILLCEAQQRIQQIAARFIESGNGIFGRWERSRSLRTNVAWFMNAPEVSSLWPK